MRPEGDKEPGRLFCAGFSYDSLSRKTSEAWYDALADADAEQNVRKTYSTTYDEAGRVASVGDGSNDLEYTYSIFGNLSSTTQDLNGLTDDVVFTYGHDVLGRKTQVSAEIGTNDDFLNNYSYDNLGRLTQITQDSVSGGNSVAEKRVDFAYSDDNTAATISRFADLAGTKAVAETDQVFDALGRVTDIVHERGATEFADYDFAWDVAGRLTDFDFTSLVGSDGDAAYTYDDTSQLTDADYDFQTDESYTYDDNGNRTNTGYSTGDHNRLTSDGTYNYTYDNEGNVTSKTNISTSESVEYTWDHRNRLTKVTFKNSSSVATKIVEYAYDHGQRWVRKTLDSNADSTIDESRIFIHDNGQIVLDFEKTGTGDASNTDLTHRYLWGAAVDQILADEVMDDGTADDVHWALTDHLNSVRDLAEYDPGTNTSSIIKHITYDAFGKVSDDSATAIEMLFKFTARPYDEDGELQNNLNRWYDLSTGRWMSTDPIGFLAGDVNLYRYVGQHPSFTRDPDGLKPPVDIADWRGFPMQYDDYFEWWFKFTVNAEGIRAELKRQLEQGCLGATCTFLGYSEYGNTDFNRALTHCFRSFEKAKNECEKRQCCESAEGKNIYGEEPTAKVVAIQFSYRYRVRMKSIATMPEDDLRALMEAVKAAGSLENAQLLKRIDFQKEI